MVQFTNNCAKIKKSLKLKPARVFVQSPSYHAGKTNQVEVEFSTAIALLRRSNITLDEFTHYAAMKTEFTLPDDIITAIKDNDTEVLEKFVSGAAKSLSRHQKYSRTQKHHSCLQSIISHDW